MEFETFSSVNAKTRRRAPLVINSSMWAFTFSTPASANTTGVVSEGIAPRPASTSTATLFAGANVSATREDPSREIVDHRVQVGASPVEQADDGGVDVPHFVGASRSQANLRLGRMHAEPRPSPAELPHQVVPGGRRGAHLAEPLRQDGERAGRDVPALGRGHHVLDRQDLGWCQSMGRPVRTGRLIVKCTGVLEPTPGMESTRRQSQGTAGAPATGQTRGRDPPLAGSWFCRARRADARAPR